jgi:protein-S-isoprenylcysteine O-methyltransferase
MSLSGISIRAFFLGIALGIALVATIILLAWHPTPLWRIPFFISSLCLFHFLEFWVTAQYNTRDAEVSAFLLSANGPAYNIAHGSAMFECLVWHYVLAPKEGEGRYWFSSQLSTIVLLFGFAAIIVGQVVRTLAMATAGSNFNHVVQARHREDHVLVTGGVYGLLRHPSYFGFFWWGLGTQLVMQNVVCFVGYAVVLWFFFNSRIQRKPPHRLFRCEHMSTNFCLGEERFLNAFFGEDYISYKSRTPVGIPFIA